MDMNVIAVTKTATAEYAANVVKITVTVSGENKNCSVAVDAADARSSALCEEFNAAVKGVSLASNGISVSAIRDDKKIIGYRASRVYSAEFAFDKTVLKNATDVLSGLSAEWRISFDFKDNGERANLLRSAVISAHSDAEAIAQAAGVKLGKLVKAEYASDGARPAILRTAAFSASAAEPEQISLSETVVCYWEIV